jgi:hypothetical protein
MGNLLCSMNQTKVMAHIIAGAMHLVGILIPKKNRVGAEHLAGIPIPKKNKTLSTPPLSIDPYVIQTDNTRTLGKMNRQNQRTVSAEEHDELVSAV